MSKNLQDTIYQDPSSQDVILQYPISYLRISTIKMLYQMILFYKSYIARSHLLHKGCRLTRCHLPEYHSKNNTSPLYPISRSDHGIMSQNPLPPRWLLNSMRASCRGVGEFILGRGGNIFTHVLYIILSYPLAYFYLYSIAQEPCRPSDSSSESLYSQIWVAPRWLRRIPCMPLPPKSRFLMPLTLFHFLPLENS